MDSCGNVSDLVVARNCCMTRMLPGEAELVSEWTRLPGRAKSVKRFERSNGLDTALYKKHTFFTFIAVSEHLGEQVMYVFFWGGASLLTLVVMYIYGGEFVDRPKLVGKTFKTE